MAEQPRKSVPLARRILVVQALVVVVAVAVATMTAVVVADRLVTAGAEERVTSVAATLAASDEIVRATTAEDPTAVLQPLAERARIGADLSFVVIMGPDGRRWTHPNPDQIGGIYIGDLEQARRDGRGTEVAEGTLGRSVRTVVRLDDPAGSEAPLGFVAVGVTLDRLQAVLSQTLPLLIGSAAAAAGIGVVVALLFGRWVRLRTRGLSAHDIEREHLHLSAVLASVREGLMAVSPDGRVALANAAARRLLGLPDDVVGRQVADLPIDPSLAAALASGEQVSDATFLAGERMVVVNQRHVTRTEGQDRAETVATIRDRTQLQHLAAELGSTRGLLAALRAQAHEADNRMQTVVTLVELGDVDEAVALATADAQRAQQLTDHLVSHVGDPVAVALLLGKTSEAHERGVELQIHGRAGGFDSRTLGIPGEDLVTVVGNLVDNALDSVVEADPPVRQVALAVSVDSGFLRLTVTDTGTGLGGHTLEQVLTPGWSTKEVPATDGPRGDASDAAAPASHVPGTADPEPLRIRGLGGALVRRVVDRLGGTIHLADRTDGVTGAVATVVIPVTPTPADVTSTSGATA